MAMAKKLGQFDGKGKKTIPIGRVMAMSRDQIHGANGGSPRKGGIWPSRNGPNIDLFENSACDPKWSVFSLIIAGLQLKICKHQ